jgi:hypothetical protein
MSLQLAQLVVLYLAPLLALVALLLCGWYPGEAAIARRIGAARSGRRRASGALPAPRRPAPRAALSCVLARRLAGRGPPGVVVVT